MSSSRTLLLWRHGQTEHNREGIFQGQLDTELSEVGLAQATAAAGQLARRGPVALWSSDLRRAAQTAAALAQVTDLQITYDARLREIDVGQWQGRRYSELMDDHGQTLAALDRGEDVRRGVDGETVAEVAARARAATEELLATLPADGTAVIASHGLATRALAADLVGLDHRAAWLALSGLHNCHWIELSEQRTGWRVIGWNLGDVSAELLVSDR